MQKGTYRGVAVRAANNSYSDYLVAKRSMARAPSLHLAALIIVPATPRYAVIGRSESGLGGRGRRRAGGGGSGIRWMQLREQRLVSLAEEALGGRGAFGTADVKVMHDVQCRELAVAEAMSAMMMPGQLTVATLHRGTAALEQIGAVAGHLFEAHALGRRQGVERMIELAESLVALAALLRIGRGPPVTHRSGLNDDT